ncbi:MAG TPA: hypothetical protein VFR20_00070 [Burkholderiaceae bacterium]|nr:hypothetical protein [Burkholderiaceae bacterium]
MSLHHIKTVLDRMERPRLAQQGAFDDNNPVGKTTLTGFGDLCSSWRMNRRPLAVFHSQAMSPLGGDGGNTFGYAGTHERRFANLAIRCPPSFGDDAGGSTAHGGPDMAALPTSAHTAHFPLTEKSARRAARQWFTGTPTATLATWCDDRCRAHCDSLPENPARTQAFHDAFAAEIGSIIAGGVPS